MYSIFITDTAQNFLNKLEKRDSEMIIKKLNMIRENPFRFVKKLKGDRLWRLRVADYRVIMEIIISNNKIIVVRIGKRENIYD